MLWPGCSRVSDGSEWSAPLSLRSSCSTSPGRAQSIAKERVRELVACKEVAVVTLTGHDQTDRWGRELGYITFNQTGLGTVLIAEGLAHARYDDLDGYDRHPRQDAYRYIDVVTPNLCE
ncbi:thermonuclease family protein [Dermatobacter hominis]|uniref:thermonuclease family protein n=1 Tax=Dermatobacter hominis TaxID=2884263 RepID=UPI001D11ED5A|nr:thermonuclease family protein [Dermatobacter hominis]UDY36278.1 thermonuclease family protein [Dermatobacter hominis]